MVTVMVLKCVCRWSRLVYCEGKKWQCNWWYLRTVWM